MSNEILVNQEALRAAVATMQIISSGTQYAHKSADLFMLSISDTADALNEAFHNLQLIEKSLVGLIEKTIAVMEFAGVTFENADQNTASKIHDSYAVESALSGQQDNGSAQPNNPESSGSLGNPFGDWNAIVKNAMERAKNRVDGLPGLSSILEIIKEWGDNKDAGALGALIAYIEDLYAFLSGERTGLSGISSLCDLFDTSADLWKNLYEQACAFSKQVKDGFLGDSAQQCVKGLGIFSALMGLFGSVTDASKNLEDKTFLAALADYLNCGEDVTEVGEAFYELFKFGQDNNWAEIKEGPWSVLKIYSAIGTAGANFVSQILRSYDKYSADGKFNVGDASSTGIDSALSGLSGLSHILTFGLDEVIYSAVDKATGGNGTSDMSYIEKAAEGYKILADKAGKALADWWKRVTT